MKPRVFSSAPVTLQPHSQLTVTVVGDATSACALEIDSFLQLLITLAQRLVIAETAPTTWDDDRRRAG